MIPIETSVDYAALIALDRRRLIDLLRGLDASSWERPTPCPAWDVLELVIHLIGVDLYGIGWLGEGLRRTNPPDGLDESGFVVWIDELQWSGFGRLVG